MHKAASKPNGIWKLVRWARERSYLPPKPPIIPPLREIWDGEVIQEADIV